MITVKVQSATILVEHMRLQSHYRQSANLSKTHVPIVAMQDFTKAPKSTVHGIHTYFISTELTTCTVHLLETGTF